MASTAAPRAVELARGEAAHEHLLHEEAEIAPVVAGSIDRTINVACANLFMANTRIWLTNSDMPDDGQLRLAKPCLILPSQQSAFLILGTPVGALNVIVINNFPVCSQYSFRDQQHKGRVLPVEGAT